ncbi:MAG: glycosyltransferase family 2 protein, partial [Nitrospiraceae bacterium]|nr:glycosyltransferase family 2 protein [Nitrospiraceae bacterium]
MREMNGPVSVIIPAYNEESGIEGVIRDLEKILKQERIPNEVIVVDDGSVDGTAPAAERSGARVIRHAKNRGYGASLKTGIMAAKHELIVITDADGTYP